jgi:hypothetical protein
MTPLLNEPVVRGPWAKDSRCLMQTAEIVNAQLKRRLTPEKGLGDCRA